MGLVSFPIPRIKTRGEKQLEGEGIFLLAVLRDTSIVVWKLWQDGDVAAPTASRQEAKGAQCLCSANIPLFILSPQLVEMVPTTFRLRLSISTNLINLDPS